MQIHAQKIIAIICQLHLEMTLKHHTEMRIDKVLFKKCIKLRSTMKKGIVECIKRCQGKDLLVTKLIILILDLNINKKMN